jgi:hypothetical protein
LTRTAVFFMEGAESTFERRVVLPLPKKPVTTVTGFLAALAPVCRFISERRAQSGVQAGIQRI